jgi:tetraacyldisaccharide 4'-kinase
MPRLSLACYHSNTLPLQPVNTKLFPLLLKSFRYLLLPISFIYGALIKLRNILFDRNLLKSASFNFPIICVGNLAVGGTGKTPMTELLVEMLQQEYHTATLSRGYKRKTKGFAIANSATTAIDIGDEPMQFHLKFPSLTVAVGEERVVAIPHLLQDRPSTQVIILDDAFQHRTVKAGLNIVLTDFKNLYTRDFMLPSGDLRDVKSSIKRAQIIIVTKCPPQLSQVEKNELMLELNPLPYQQLFFATLAYGQPYHLFNHQTSQLDEHTEVLLLCGIANPKPLKEYLNSFVKSYDMMRYGDHHIFSSEDLKDIKKNFDKMTSDKKVIITTEKDAVRLHKFQKELQDYPIYAIPIQHRILFDEYDQLSTTVHQFINSFSLPPLKTIVG